MVSGLSFQGFGSPDHTHKGEVEIVKSHLIICAFFALVATVLLVPVLLGGR